jgi:hypothetical protein
MGLLKHGVRVAYVHTGWYWAIIPSCMTVPCRKPMLGLLVCAMSKAMIDYGSSTCRNYVEEDLKTSLPECMACNMPSLPCWLPSGQYPPCVLRSPVPTTAPVVVGVPCITHEATFPAPKAMLVGTAACGRVTPTPPKPASNSRSTSSDGQYQVGDVHPGCNKSQTMSMGWIYGFEVF